MNLPNSCRPEDERTQHLSWQATFLSGSKQSSDWKRLLTKCDDGWNPESKHEGCKSDNLSCPLEFCFQ